ncbi:hypothetical protein MHK_000592, partial [Candidatus Magnetomorum sp. HK-1]
ANTLKKSLDIGESEAIALAHEKNADVLIIDEKAGRIVARQYVKIIGLVGVLLSAKKKKIINEIKPILIKLKNSGFKLSNNLFAVALEKAGE